MPKSKKQKEELLAQVTDRLQRSKAIVLVNIQGVKVDQMEEIRDRLHPDGMQLQVAKNTLLKIALKEIGVQIPDAVLDQPVGVIYNYQDTVGAAKAAVPFAKDIEALEILGGLLGDQFVLPAQVTALSKLGTRDELRAQVVGTIAAPLNGFVNVMAGNLRSLVTVMGAVRDSKA